MSQLTNFLVQPYRYVGESWNASTCFLTRDDYFDCLDKENSINVSRKVCLKEHQLWKDACPDGDRKAQMIYRRIEKQNEALYTPEELKQYNHEKNNMSFK